MTGRRDFALITAADFVVRSAYQVGKTPLLPIFAVSLGAGEVFLGVIVSVSTLTGMMLKPLFGILSDRWGRRLWLLVGTGFFAGMPFAYHLVESPEHLFLARLLHGLATAIYGPVTIAYVAELSPLGRAERIGWFSSARNAGYVIGPAAAGGMLLFMDPVAIFTVVGIISALAFIPVLMLPETARGVRGPTPPLLKQASQAVRSVGRTPAVWLAGSLDAQFLIAKYAVKTFLPLHALSLGISPAVVGAVLATQEMANMALSPLGGRVGDRIGYVKGVSVGMLGMCSALALMALASDGPAMLAPAVLMGVAQAVVFPSTIALVSARASEAHLGAGMGMIGTLKNAGKVAGPVAAGLLVHSVGFTATLMVMAGLVLLAAAVVWTWGRVPPLAEEDGRPHLKISGADVPGRV